MQLANDKKACYTPMMDVSGMCPTRTFNFRSVSSAMLLAGNHGFVECLDTVQFAIAPIFLENKGYLIAVAFVSVTFDPIRGVGQKSDNVWIRVHEKFCLLQQKELGSDTYTRNKDLTEQRWKKRINRNVQLWSKHYQQLKGMNKKSGWN